MIENSFKPLYSIQATFLLMSVVMRCQSTEHLLSDEKLQPCQIYKKRLWIQIKVKSVRNEPDKPTNQS